MNETRRSLLKLGAVGAASWALPMPEGKALSCLSKPITLGVITDTHIGLVDDGAERLSQFLKAMKKVQPDAVVQLGDFAFPDPKYQASVDAFNAAANISIHTIGNHDLDHGLTRDDCLKCWSMPNRYYAKLVGGLKLLVLDGNDQGSPTHGQHGGYPSYIGQEQQDWLQEELDQTEEPVMILSHQPLAGRAAVDNASALQELIANYRDKVLLCINGHTHIDQQVNVSGVNYLHCNSASYFWLGGKTRFARYRDPLFATLTIDPGKRQIRVKGVESRWLNSPQDAGYFEEKPEELKQLIVPQIRDRTIGGREH